MNSTRNRPAHMDQISTFYTREHVIMEKRMGVVSIIVGDRKREAGSVNDIITKHSNIVLARMGLPCRDRGLSVIALIIEATTNEVGAFTGQLGNLSSVKVKSSLV
ncbi:TM1266 family iron-only hydrogenase system putative regulator [Halodesulfovibrio aestuarii]|uniref:TM1266 family iron-only hydrogenase system putative regulator n=1 Tax=Halodesulfovibrio aestuarii TaxID=126333 RepID=UPI003D359208